MTARDIALEEKEQQIVTIIDVRRNGNLLSFKCSPNFNHRIVILFCLFAFKCEFCGYRIRQIYIYIYICKCFIGLSCVAFAELSDTAPYSVINSLSFFFFS